MYELLASLSDTIGIVGVVLLIIAYLLLNTGKLIANSLTYQYLNLAGASFILFSLFFTWNTAAVLIESVWIAISLLGICRILYQKK
jgi:hypothetical protein